MVKKANQNSEDDLVFLVFTLILHIFPSNAWMHRATTKSTATLKKKKPDQREAVTYTRVVPLNHYLSEVACLWLTVLSTINNTVQNTVLT